MRKVLTRIFGCILIFISIVSFSQDSSVYKWDYKSKKTSDGKYELIFSTNGVAGWQLYSPNQKFDEKESAKLEFKDSSIIIENVSESGKSKTFLSPIFGDTVKVYEGQTEWKIPITITGAVPAKLQGVSTALVSLVM